MSEANPESSPDELLKREELFKRHQGQTWADLQSSSDEYDKAILALAGGGLTLSLGFIKDVVPLDKAVSLHLLLLSWVFFALSLLAVVASYVLGVEAQKLNLDHLKRYYIDGDEAFLSPKNGFNTWLQRCNLASGLFLFVAVVLTIGFAWQNISAGNFVSNDKNSARANDARPVILATPFKADSNKARQVMPATPIAPQNAAPQATPSAPQPQSTPAPTPADGEKK